MIDLISDKRGFGIWEWKFLNLESIGQGKDWYENGVFSGCSSLKSLPDISKWNISKVKDMSYAFADCNSLEILPDISKWDTSDAIKMNYLFKNYTSLKSLSNIQKLDIIQVKEMKGIFEGCSESLVIPLKFK